MGHETEFLQLKKIRNICELNNKVLCVVGCGSVGTECAKWFKAFGCKVNEIDLYLKENEYYDQISDLDELDRILVQADIVILTVPLTEDTWYLLNKGGIAFLKDRSVIVNIARGDVMN